MWKDDAICRWFAASLALIALSVSTSTVAAERSDGAQSIEPVSKNAPTEESVEPAISVVTEAEQSLETIRKVVEAARREVSQLETAKRAADSKADQAIADATKGLQSVGPGSTGKTAEELRGEVASAIHASDEAGRALAEARVKLASAEKAAAEEATRLIAEVKATGLAAEKHVSELKADAKRSADEVAKAVSMVAEAEAARFAAEAELERRKRIALDAINRAADSRRALADAEATDVAIDQGLERLSTEAARLSPSIESAETQQ
jgi:hypothetical protein